MLLDTVIVLDYGSQYTQLIARRIREQKVYSEILPWDVPVEDILAKSPRGIVLSGGPNSVHAPGAPGISEDLLRAGIPILGICYGMQVLAKALGGLVERGKTAEYGRSTVRFYRDNALLQGLSESSTVWMSHWDHVAKLPEATSLLAESDDGIIAGFAAKDRNLWALQFHPEVVHTREGSSILRNFLFSVCACEPSWDLGEFVESMKKDIREKTGEDRIICGLSGGVDSSVAAVLTSQAVGDRLECIFVNNGLLRQNEAEEVLEAYSSLDLRVHYVDAGERFLQALQGVTDPEQKRKIIGGTFIRVFEDAAEKVGGAAWLLQGTLYPDVIESGHQGKGAAVIKTHHNVGGLPEDMELRLLEPLRDLFKDEVRAIGSILGVPGNILGRHPFPGPGLGVRCLGELTEERLETLRKADAIFIQILREEGLYDSIWQAFCVLLPVHTVGVMGDIRTYAEAVVLRAVEAQDGMTADWARIDPSVLDRAARRICNEVPGVNRVVLDITGKPPGTIEWE
ncbi:MAG TPA: glutamine-hydrolyzing GMP synthase [Synergistaceae bacterium]|nr:glutamine-hydrolyzing GMP synthase [Synergistaceae bacterium]HPQ37275.1 glutamine-hydrolyzing GMP synthase [Synergistaceae bacterium]